ncbi:MAG TPA: response regulator [Microvirga sp.]|jgi:CheY-like chemotaxis protein|nr:response regulator [Microvirga sp.]
MHIDLSRSGLPVLLAEGDALARMVTTDILDEAGYRVIAAANADEALQLLHFRPDTKIVLANARLPGSMDGYTLARVLVRKHFGVPVVVLGDSLPSPGDLPAGAQFLSTPAIPSVLLGLIRALLAQYSGVNPTLSGSDRHPSRRLHS